MKTTTATYDSLSDEELMVQLANGMVPAFNVLYKRYRDRMHYYFYRMLGGVDLKAQDFVQDLFMKIIDKPNLFNPKKKFSTWIYSVAHNMCKNEYRSIGVRRIMEHSDQMEKHFVDFDENGVDIKDFTKELYIELDKMDEDSRTAFLLKFREGFKIKEISEIIGFPEGTIKSRLFYTTKKLQERLSHFSTICEKQ